MTAREACSEIRNHLQAVLVAVERLGAIAEDWDDGSVEIARDAAVSLGRITVALNRIDGGATSVDVGALLVALGRAHSDMEHAQALVRARRGQSHAHNAFVKAHTRWLECRREVESAADTAYLAECERLNETDKAAAAEGG